MIFYQCCNHECHTCFSALSFSTVLPKHAGRGLTPSQVLEGIKYYTAAGIAKPPSPEAAAKLINCGRKPMLRLFAALRAKEAELGCALQKRTKLKLNVEV